MGAFECAASGLFGQGLVNLDADNVLDLSCLSQLTECYTYSGCAVALVNGGKNFSSPLISLCKQIGSTETFVSVLQCSPPPKG